MSNGNGGDGFGGIFDPIIGMLQAVIQAIIDFLNALIQALVQIFNYFFAIDEYVFGFSVDGLKAIWMGLTKLLSKVLLDIILAMLKKLWDLYQKLAAWVKKLKAWLDKFHKLQRIQQLQAMRRIINLIQRVRQILVIFRLFHVKWAQRLDTWLAGIESSIIRHVMDNERKTNEIIAWINLIADPTTLFRQVPQLRSFGRAFTALLRAINPALLRQVYPYLGQPVVGPMTPQKFADWYTGFLSDVATDSGDQAAFGRQATTIAAMIEAELG